MWQYALAAMLASTAIQQRAAKEAEERQQAAIQRSLEAQRQFQIQAEQRAMATANEFDADKRSTDQQQIAQEIETSMVEPVLQSQQERSQQQAPTGDVSSTYAAEKASSELEAIKNARVLAGILAKTKSADRLRIGESLKMMDAGQEIDMLGNFSRGQLRADQYGIENAGRLDGKKMALAGLLNMSGQMAMFSGGSGGLGGAMGAQGYSVNSSPTIAASPGQAPVFDISPNNSFLRGFR